MTLNDVENLDGRAQRVPRFHGIRDEKADAGREAICFG